MNKKITLVTLIMFFACMVHAQWNEHDLGTGEYSNKMFSFNNDTALIAGNDTVVIRTDDGGLSWSQVELNTVNPYEYHFMDIDFSDKNTGYMVSSKVTVNSVYENGIVMKTVDNGLNWDEIPLSAFSDGTGNVATDPTSSDANKVSFSAVGAGTDAIYAAAKWENATGDVDYGYIFKSADQGSSWSIVSSDLGSTTINAIAVSGSTLYIAGSSGTFMKSADAGATWTDYSNAGYISVNDITLIDENTLYIPTTGGVYYTSDGGVNLTQIGSDMAFDVLSFTGQDVILAGGLSTKTNRTTDGGANWAAANRGLNSSAFEFEVFNDTIYALCSGGVVYKLQINELKDLVVDFGFELSGAKVSTDNLTQNAGTYKWSDGEGNSFETENFEHIYSDYSTYKVKLVAENAVMIDSVEKDVAVEELTVDFTTTLEEGNKVVLTNNSTNCAAYNWDFGNAEFSTDENPTQVYDSLGSFTISLEAHNYIDTLTATASVTVDSVGVPWNTNKVNTSQILQKLYSFDDQTAILIGNSTTILRTEDGGTSWAEASYPEANKGHVTNDIIFFDNQNGLISCSASGSTNGFLLKTTDQGLNWTAIDVSAFSDGSGDATVDPAAGSRVYFFHMDQISENTGFVALRWEDESGAKHGYVYKTEDKGASWTKSSGDIFTDYGYSSFITALDFADDNTTGYLSGNKFLLKTEDAGETWTNLSADDLGYINDFVVVSAETVLAATGNGTLKTTDGFETYEFKTTDYSFDIVAIDDTTLLAGKDGATLKVSRDLGENWEPFGNGLDLTFFELAKFNNKVYALSIMGTNYISLLDNYYTPVADFNFTIDDLTVSFENLCDHLKNYEWDFGDENTSTDANPTHDYADYGTYTIVLKGSNSCKVDSVSKEITLSEVTAVEGMNENFKCVLYPNPIVEDILNIDISREKTDDIHVEIYDIIGNKVQEEFLENNSTNRINMNVKSGLYLIHIKSGNQILNTKKVIVK